MNFSITLKCIKNNSIIDVQEICANMDYIFEFIIQKEYNHYMIIGGFMMIKYVSYGLLFFRIICRGDRT